jgi:hypothetical protein
LWWLTFILLTWRIWWTSNNANIWQMGFNSTFKGLNWIMCWEIPSIFQNPDTSLKLWGQMHQDLSEMCVLNKGGTHKLRVAQKHCRCHHWGEICSDISWVRIWSCTCTCSWRDTMVPTKSGNKFRDGRRQPSTNGISISTSGQGHMNNLIDDGEKTIAFCFDEQTKTIQLFKFGDKVWQHWAV